MKQEDRASIRADIRAAIRARNRNVDLAKTIHQLQVFGGILVDGGDDETTDWLEILSEFCLEISPLPEKIKSLQANINSKQQSINQLTTENRVQADKINGLLLVATDKRSLENELKSLKTQLKNSTEQNQHFKQKMENQKAELKILTTKSNTISLLNSEIANLKSQLEEKQQAIDDSDTELDTCNKKIQQLEHEIKQYEEILNDLDGHSKLATEENSSQECAICCELFSEDRKRVAYGPCGHSMTCVECSDTMLRKPTAGRMSRKSTNCPICRSQIESTIILQGIY